jgi:hypothetical protein
MAAAACGIQGNGQVPADPDDLNRCIRLVNAVPELRERFDAIAASTPQWKVVIEHWDELVELFHSEVGPNWSKGRFAPRTYARMKELGC